jgi:hypothetical protein
MADLAPKQPRLLTRVVGLGTAFAVTALAVLSGSTLLMFIHPPSILFVGGIAGGLLLATHGVVGTQRAVRTAIVGGTQAQLERATAFYLQAGALAIGSGVLGSLIGLVQMLQQMDDPTKIGPALALSLLTCFYGLGGAMVSFSAAIATARRSPTTPHLEATAGLSSIVLSGAAALALMPSLFGFSFFTGMWL